MSDANLATVAFQAETSLGILPTPQLQQLRYTKESLKFSKETVSSAEVRPDRQKPDMQKVFGQPEGGFEFELSRDFILPMIEAALMSEWVVFNITANMVLDAGTQTATAAAGTFDDVPTGAMIVLSGAGVAGNAGAHRVIDKEEDGTVLYFNTGSLSATQGSQSVTIAGKSITNGINRKSMVLEKRLLNTAGEDYYQVFRGMTIDTLELRIESKRLVTGAVNMVGTSYELPANSLNSGGIAGVKASGIGNFVGNPSEGDTINIAGVIYTFTAALADPYDVLIGVDDEASLDNLGAAINGGAGEGSTYGTGTDSHPLVTFTKDAADEFTIEAISTGAIGNTISTTSQTADITFVFPTLVGGTTETAGYLPATDGEILNGTNNMGTIRMDGSAAQDRFKMINLTIGNNVRGKDALATEGNFDIGLGQVNVTGSLNAYFRDNSLPTKIKEHTTFSLDFYVRDSTGKRLYFYIPATKPANGDPAITGINTDVMIETQFEAIKGTTTENPTGRTIIIDAIDL